MDRSFLSQPEVIAASRQFICIRLTTYEDENEVKFLRSLFIGISGDVENTTFTILAPDGQTSLIRAGRSPRSAFANATEMAKAMTEIAGRYPAKSEETTKTPALPVTLTGRLGLDVAASDGLPLAVVMAAEESRRLALETRLAELAWSKEFIGQFTYATAASAMEVLGVSGVQSRDSFVIIEPDAFGQKGTLVKQIDANQPAAHVADAMRTVLAAHQKMPEYSREHRAEGIAEGMFWQTKLPVTDRMELNARSLTKRQIEQQQK